MARSVQKPMQLPVASGRVVTDITHPLIKGADQVLDPLQHALDRGFRFRMPGFTRIAATTGSASGTCR